MRGRARRRPRLARARRRGADRRRHGARRRPAARRAPGRTRRASRCAWSSTGGSRRRPARTSSSRGRPLLIYAAARRRPARRPRSGARRRGHAACPAPSGKVDLAAMLRDLAAREVNELHVEAGHKLNGSLMREGLVDELLVYLAPKLLGHGPRHRRISGRSTTLAQALALEFLSTSSRSGPTCASSPASRARPLLASPAASQPAKMRRCSPASSPASAASPPSTPSAALCSHGKRLTIEAPAGYLDDVRPRRQHRAQRRLHDRHALDPAAAASPSTSRPNPWTRPPASPSTGPRQPREGAARPRPARRPHRQRPRRRRRHGQPTSSRSAKAGSCASWRRRRWRSSSPTRARSPSTA